MFVLSRQQKDQQEEAPDQQDADQTKAKGDQQQLQQRRGDHGSDRRRVRLHSAPLPISSASSGLGGFRLPVALTPHKKKKSKQPLLPSPTKSQVKLRMNYKSPPQQSRRRGDQEEVVSTPQQAFERFQQKLQRLAGLLHVHPLSNAIEFTLDNKPLQVCVLAWWKEIQRQSLLSLQHRHGGGGGGLAAGANVVSSLKQLKPKERVLFFTHAMQLLIESWDQVHQQLRDEAMAEYTHDHVTQAVAKVFVKLISKWIRSSTNGFLESIAASVTTHTQAQIKHQAMKQFVNVLIQWLPNVGRMHPSHQHKLICSSIRRAFNDSVPNAQTIRWKCSCCERIVVVPLSNAISEGSMGIFTYRCTACDVNLCRECITRIPNGLSMAPSPTKATVHGGMTHRLDGLLTLVFDYMAQQDPGHFSVYAMSIAVNAATRWKELPTSRVNDLNILRLVVDMIQSKAFVLELVHHMSWLPPILSGLQLQTHSFLGGFFWGSTITEEPLCAPDASLKEKQMVEQQVQRDFEEYQQVLKQMVQVFVDIPTQSEEVVQAFLGWLACICETNSSGSRLDQGNDLSTDGFVINLSATLVSLVLEKWRTQDAIDARYHQSRANRRAYGPQESCVGGAVDFECFDQKSDPQPSRQASSFYKRLGHHYGVVCDVCGVRDFGRIRYKCLNCQDYDLCDNCFDKLHRHRSQHELEQVEESNKDDSADSASYHKNQHVFVRISIPIPLSLTRTFVPVPAELNSTRSDNASSSPEDEDKPCEHDSGTNGTVSNAEEPIRLNCLCCGIDLLQEQWFYQCAFCGFEHLEQGHDDGSLAYHCRVVCENCMLEEEALADLNPFRTHRVGHQYVCIPTTPRMLERRTQKPFLRLERLLFPAALVPTMQFDVFTELFYLSIKSLHVGPLRTLSRLVAAQREILEARSFCVSEDWEHEAGQQTGTNGGHTAHYNSCKSRLKSLERTAASVELHLLLSSNVVNWIQFYSRVCRWLLETQWPCTDSSGSSSSNGMNTWLCSSSSTSPSTSKTPPCSVHAFPQHFFFDLCEVLFFVSSWQFREPCASEVNSILNDRTVVEPLLVMLVQFVASDEVTRNPHLRLETLRALCAFLGFLAKDKHRMALLDSIFKANDLFHTRFVTRCLHFHDQLEIYFVTNQNGFMLGNHEGGNGGADSAFFLGKTSMVTMRVLMGSLLRFLAQFPVTYSQLDRIGVCHVPDCACHGSSQNLGNGAAPGAAQRTTNSSFVLERFFNGFWGDMIGLLEEIQGKTGLLKHLVELQQSVARFGTDVSLPFRPAMMEGYAALHWKHLRVLLCLLFEVVELTGWCSEVQAVKQMLLQKPQLFEKASQAICFGVVTLVANVHKSPNWQFSAELMAKARLLMALLVIVCVKWAALDKSCSMSCLWKLCSSHGMQIAQQVGDLEASCRWELNSSIIRIESARYLGDLPRLSDDATSQGQDESEEEDKDEDKQNASHQDEEEEHEQEMDVNSALEMLERQSARSFRRQQKQQVASRLAEKFIASLSNDGRFDAKLFAVASDLLRKHDLEQQRQQLHPRLFHEPEPSSKYCSIDVCWLDQFVELLGDCREQLELHREIEASLGEIPEEFLDPLLNTLMTDPVRLPSGHVVDRNVIERHLGSGRSGVDPFTREPLTTEMLTPCEELRDQINAFVHAKLSELRRQKQQQQEQGEAKPREDVLATWGLGWDLILSTEASEEHHRDAKEQQQEQR